MTLILRNEKLVFFIAVGVSILLSACLNLRETVINSDAICYLLSAETYTQAGLTKAMNLCEQSKWPFYSVLIANFTQLTHFSYIFSAYLLNGFFSLLSVWMFLIIIKELGGTKRILWIAACIILLSHEFNNVRQYIIRDHGFWAFYLVSLFGLLRYVKYPTWLNSFIFSLSLLIATLFRIEGLIFLLALPFILLFCKQRTRRLYYFFMLNLPNLVIFGGICLWLVLYPHHHIEKLSRVAEVFNQLHNGIFLIFAQFQQIKTALMQHILTAESARDASLLLFLVMMMWYLINVIGNLSWVYSALVIYAWVNKVMARNLVLIGYLMVNVMITLSFFAQHLFLSKRYLIALSLTLMLWVPFALDKLFQQRFVLKYRILLGLAVFCIFISSLGGIIDFGYSKKYINQAGSWVAANVPAKASLYVNDSQLMYYTQHFNETLFQKYYSYMDINSIAQDKWRQYDYLAIRLNKNEDPKIKSVINTISLTPIKVFANKRGDQVIIYKK